MLSLKVYNSLPYSKRKQLAKLVFHHMSDEFVEEMSQPFHHDFEHEGGDWYKTLLSHLSLIRDGQWIKVTFSIPVK